MHARKTRRSARGFTLIELIVAMAILTIVAGAAIPVYSRSMKRERSAGTRAELMVLDSAIRAYFEDTGAFPPTFDDLLRDGERMPGWTGPYATLLGSGGDPGDTGLATDSWGREYRVAVTSASRIEIRSAGADGVAPTDDDLAQSVDVTPIRRAQTLDELAILNAAVAAYNATHLPDAPLSTASHRARLASLVSGGYLPGGTARFDADGWGDTYIADPPGRSPVVAVTSIHLTDADAEEDDDDDRDRGDRDRGDGDDDEGDDDDSRGRGPPDTPPGHDDDRDSPGRGPPDSRGRGH